MPFTVHLGCLGTLNRKVVATSAARMAMPSESSALREGPELRELGSILTASSSAVPVTTMLHWGEVSEGGKMLGMLERSAHCTLVMACISLYALCKQQWWAY